MPESLFSSSARPSLGASSLVRVVPLTPVEGAFTYGVPEALAEDVQVGSRVVIPFGRRTLTGVVVGPAEENPSFRVKDLSDVLDERPAVPTDLLALTHWIADYYLCTWGEALKAALPTGTEVTSRRTVTALAPPEAWDGPDLGRRVLAAIHKRQRRRTTTTALRRDLGRTVPTRLLDRMEEAGVLHVEEAVSARVTEKTEAHLHLAGGTDVPAALDDLRGHRQQQLLTFLADAEAPVRQAEALQETGASTSTVASLLERGLVVKEERAVERTADALDAAPDGPPPSITLHPAQTEALAAITEALEASAECGEPHTFLLRGVTGSGKTEVYLRALRRALAAEKSAIVLVPEIALTPQTVRRFRAHFGDRVAVLHSRMSDGERRDAWHAIRDGRYPVVIGPRSAVLAPVADLGLVIVDEEHEGSYKQFDPAPRYHARDVAVMRAHRAGAVCVLGSATPSLESLANVKAERYTLLRMPERVPVAGHEAAPLPPVRTVDLAREFTVKRLKGALSDALRDAIRERLSREEQVILLQNRRGFAPVLSCQTCGHTPTCPDCAVTLTLHRPRGPSFAHLRCHYCGIVERIPDACPRDGGEMAPLGSGTQKIEEELAEVVPEARVLRMDLDTTSRKGAHARILGRFGRGEAHVLLGTQMVAKGLDFPRVTLVGVVNADTGLLLPDFRAAERTFQLLAQVAGRAGRHDLPGEVILQTRSPEHAAIQHALHHDFWGFVREEMADRRALGYPPFARMIGVEFKGPEEASTLALARTWTEALESRCGELSAVEVLGPTAALIGRVQRMWRFHTLLKAPRALPPSRLGALVRAVEEAVAVPNRHRVNIDVDPVGMF